MKNNYYGIFFTALATLMYEILLTRIFSVTMGYHFAFMAVSIAMFGMTAGAMLVFFRRNYFTVERLSRWSLLFSITIILSFLFHLYIPFRHDLTVWGILIVGATYTVISVPFVFSGIVVCLVLSSFTKYTGKLYAADLIGAGLGCILVIWALDYTGGPASVFIVAFLAGLGAFAFIRPRSAAEKNTRPALVFYLAAIGIFAAINSYLAIEHEPLIRLKWVRGEPEEKSIYEEWNSFSRVNITGDTNEYVKPFGWGLSATFDSTKRVKQLMMNVDAHSTTVLTGFSGDSSELEHLKYDVANVVHYLRNGSDIAVIGSGGGRDILAAILFKQRAVLGLEINEEMVKAVNGYFGNFTGRLNEYPQVTFVADEARSYLTRLDKKFDAIQLTVIDNWSATSSGAFVLTENALYTLESWKILFEHLKPDGILSVTRYYRDIPSEIYRLAALSAATLKTLQIQNAAGNIIVIKNNPRDTSIERRSTGTILSSPTAFSKTDIDTIKAVCERMKFEIIYPAFPFSRRDSPEEAARGDVSAVFAALASAEDITEYANNFSVDISPPADDSPFFFFMLRLKDIFNFPLHHEFDMSFNLKAVFILFSVLAVVVFLSVICIILPLVVKSRTHAKDLRLLVYFACIGLGFMLIEISQIQRFNIFLGHPVYSLSVSLFALLISTGIGSYLSSISYLSSLSSLRVTWKLIGLLTVLVIFGGLTPYLIDLFRGASTPVRIMVAAGSLFPIGLLIGTAFPIGIRLASAKSGSLIPWLWGINGAMSVVASVLAVLIAMTLGIKAAYWTGFGFYVIAVGAGINRYRMLIKAS
jgi:SAM-dependent methyltransferase